MGHRALAVFLVAHRLAQAIAHAAADRRIHRAAGHHRAQHHRLVLALHLVLATAGRPARYSVGSVRATTIRPEVSLSSRCTMPARGSSASFGS